jgi:transposase
MAESGRSCTHTVSSTHTGEFVALTLAQPSTPLSPGDIRIELRRGTTTMSIHWPILGGGECAAWLREWLR